MEENLPALILSGGTIFLSFILVGIVGKVYSTLKDIQKISHDLALNSFKLRALIDNNALLLEELTDRVMILEKKLEDTEAHLIQYKNLDHALRTHFSPAPLDFEEG